MFPKAQKNKKNMINNDVIIKFLEMTKEGKFSQIDEQSLQFSRLAETTDDTVLTDDEYFYGIS